MMHENANYSICILSLVVLSERKIRLLQRATSGGETVLSSVGRKAAYMIAIVVVGLFFSERQLVFPFRVGVPSMHFYLLLMALMAMLLLVQRKYYIDVVTLLLASRLIVYLLPHLAIMNFEGFLGNYSAVIASFVSYLVFSQRHSHETKHQIRWIMLAFLFALSLQVLYMARALSVELGVVHVGLWKYHLALPIGNSNFISAVILFLMVFVYHTEFVWQIKGSAILLGLIALFAVLSRTSILVLVLLFLIEFATRYVRMIRRAKGHSLVIPIIVVTVVLVLTLSFAIFYGVNYLLVRGDMGMTFNEFSLMGGLNALTSGRVDIVIFQLDEWASSPVIGTGFAFAGGARWSHNWLIDLLAQSGVVGFALFISALGISVLRVRKYAGDNTLVLAIFRSCIAVLLVGLGEVVLFTILIDLLFWGLLGIAIAEVNHLQRNARSALEAL